MKKIIFIFIWLSIAYCSIADSIDSVRKNKIGVEIGGFMLSQSYDENFKNSAIYEWRPNIGFWYERNLWREFAIGVRYDYKLSDPNAKWYKQTLRDIDCVAKDNSIFLSFSYTFKVNNFFIKPNFAVGACFPHFTTPGQGDHLKTIEKKIVITYHGVTIGYGIKKWEFFMAYNFDMYRCRVYFDEGVSASWMFPTRFTHHVLRLGTSYNF